MCFGFRSTTALDASHPKRGYDASRIDGNLGWLMDEALSEIQKGHALKAPALTKTGLIWVKCSP